jgi:hypothetical protein
VILQDLRLTINASLLTNAASGIQESFPALSKAASALIITSLIWTTLIFGLIQVMPTKFIVQIIPLLVLLSLSIFAWVIYNYIFYKQFAIYQSELANSSAGNPAVVGGAGFWVFLVYVLCTILITPVTSFWFLVTCLFLVICFIILMWICFMCMLAMVACILGGGGGGGTETEMERIQRLGGFLPPGLDNSPG